MNKLYQKSEIVFAIIWIIVYVVGTGIVDGISQENELNKIPTFIFHVILTAAIRNTEYVELIRLHQSLYIISRWL